MRIRLTPAQVSALECAGLDLEPLSDGERAVLAAWEGHSFVVRSDTVDDIQTGLTELANSEDYVAENRGDRGARGACRALCNLSDRVFAGCR